VTPCEGYRVKVWRDRELKLRLPMLSAAVSREKLFDVFTSLIELLGEELHVVLEGSHGRGVDDHVDHRRNNIDAPVLLSHCYDFEDLLLDDGCTGIAVLKADEPVEVQFDEHKLITIYAPDLAPFERILAEAGIRKRPTMAFLSEGEHLHHSAADHPDRFREFCWKLGVGDEDCVLSDEETW
jgi:hypothetical protein